MSRESCAECQRLRQEVKDLRRSLYRDNKGWRTMRVAHKLGVTRQLAALLLALFDSPRPLSVSELNFRLPGDIPDERHPQIVKQSVHRLREKLPGCIETLGRGPHPCFYDLSEEMRARLAALDSSQA